MSEPRRLTRAQSIALRQVVTDTEVRAYRRDRDEPDNWGVDADRIDTVLRDGFEATTADADRLAHELYPNVVSRTREYRMSEAVRAQLREQGAPSMLGAAEADAKAAYRRATAEAAREHASKLRELAARLDALAAVEEIRAEDFAADAKTARFVDALLGRTSG